MAAKRRYTLENREVATSHSQRFFRDLSGQAWKNLSKGKMSMQKMVGVFKSSISFFIKPRVLVPRSLTKREER